MKVKILGTTYTIRRPKDGDEAKIENAYGFCELMSKEIVIEKASDGPAILANAKEFEKKVLRHEIIHAFIYESGLYTSNDWATDEELVDWMAIQIPKMVEAFKSVDCM